MGCHGYGSKENAMFRSLNILRDYRILATDGSLGSVSDVYFDDRGWTVRHLVVDTGTWLPGRRVLIPTSALGTPDAARDEFPVDLTKEQVRNAPSIDEDKPVDRQHEAELYGYYGWAPYWGGDVMMPGGVGVGGLGDAMSLPGSIPPEPLPSDEGDPHLRSGRDIIGYAIAAADSDIGEVSDILIDDQDWRIRYFLVDTGKWLPGRKVVLSPEWVKSIEWAEHKVVVDLTREQVEASPEYDEVEGVNRAYEEGLYAHYRRNSYWV